MSNPRSGTQIGGMAQRQKNVIDSDGLLVYTKQLENYEKVRELLAL